MFTYRRHAVPKPLSKAKERLPGAAPPPACRKAAPKHLDYDLTPLEVGGLSHYIEPPSGNDRFRVR